MWNFCNASHGFMTLINIILTRAKDLTQGFMVPWNYCSFRNMSRTTELGAMWKRKHRQVFNYTLGRLVETKSNVNTKMGDASGGREWPSTTLSLGKPCGLTNTTIDAEFLSLSAADRARLG